MSKITVMEGAEPLRWMLEEHRKLERERGPIRLGPSPDGLITLKAAAALPELGGVVSIKSIRAAIARCDIQGFQPGGPSGTVYVTRPEVIAWIEKCRANPSRLASTSEQPATKLASSARTRHGSSSMRDPKRALDAALRTARALKKR